MPICEMCTASYDEKFKFCPYCGRARPEPKVSQVNVNVQVADASYEEATLKIELLEKRPVSEPPFNWRPSLLEKILGEKGDAWEEICIYHLVLDAVHSIKGHYNAFTSSTFRSFQPPKPPKRFSLPTRLKNRLVSSEIGHEWLRRFFQERKEAWDGLNQYLISESWHGISSKARKRQPPFEIHFNPSLPSKAWDKADVLKKNAVDLLSDGYLSIGKWWYTEAHKPDYRYQRTARG